MTPDEKGGAAAAVSALTAKAKLAGMWRDKVDQHNTGTPAYGRIERIIVERPSPTTGCCQRSRLNWTSKSSLRSDRRVIQASIGPCDLKDFL
jgi:hypothetical protein